MDIYDSEAEGGMEYSFFIYNKFGKRIMQLPIVSSLGAARE